MDKGAIKTFAIEARKILMKSAATQAGFYGVTKDGCADPIQKGAGFEVYRTIAGTENRIYGNDINRRRKLKEAVESQGFDQVIEETAYTWFNRLIAIRFMEVNGYLPTRTRVLSSETGSNTPDLVAQYLDVDLGMSDEEIEKVAGSIKDNRYDDAFALLFVKQCNALNELLPKLFEKTDDYMELLLKLSYTSDGVVRMLVDSIPESNFNVEEEGQVEIIGWMYQYYNTEPKSAAFAKKGKVTKEEIPAVTQLFTPDWIVRYMVENSLGRLWIEGHSDDELKENWRYYLEETKQEQILEEQLEKIRSEHTALNPEEIKIIDPCMGSGHILVYAFDLLVQIYESQGYSTRDIPQLILENNLFGLDIDNRAAQLAYFAVMMKACQYNRRFLRKKIQPFIMVIPESNNIKTYQFKYFGNRIENREKILRQVKELIEATKDAKEFGSLIDVADLDWNQMMDFANDLQVDGQLTLDVIGIEETQSRLQDLINLGIVLAKKYEVVCTNPPYMNKKAMNETLNSFLVDRYPDVRNDLFAVFISKAEQLCARNGYISMIVQNALMFLTGFEKLRDDLLEKEIVNLLHLGPRAFDEIGGEVVQSCTFSIRNTVCANGYKGEYHRLIKGIGEKAKEQDFISKKYTYSIDQWQFKRIPGHPFAYWISPIVIDSFENCALGDLADPRQGLSTSDNERFLRLWFENDVNNIAFGCESHEQSAELCKKWYPYNKGGSFRKWYGNVDYTINWQYDGKELREWADWLNKHRTPMGRLVSKEYYFKKGMSWSALTTGNISFRYTPKGFLFDSKGPMCFPFEDEKFEYIFAFLNSKVAMMFLELLAPTLDFNQGPIRKLPFKFDANFYDEIKELVHRNIAISKMDWDDNETSWDFSRHPLVNVQRVEKEESLLLERIYYEWVSTCNERLAELRKNEEAINRIFIDIYGLNNTLAPEIDDCEIVLHRPNENDDVKRLISYAVGCMFGRYSLDKEGLEYAGGQWNKALYGRFVPDEDNCIPITDEAYFGDDIVGLFCEFIKIVYGKETLEQNLDFIAKALGNKGKTTLEVIRNYFLNDFFKDHCAAYSVAGSGKRPIYWLFDSGKQNGFKCLIYMHRYDKDTVGRVRSDYLRKAQDAIEAALKNAEYTIANSTSAVDKAAATKKREKYIKQLNETRAYFQALSHVALQRIEIDLDDGVKTNYAKFQGIEIVDENGKKQKIDLLAKI